MTLSTTDDRNCQCKENYKIIIDSILNRDIYRCISPCPYGYYLDDYCKSEIPNNYYAYQNKSLVSECPLFILDDKFCLEKCPDSAPFFEITNNEKVCKSSCGDSFYYSDTKQCFSSNDNCNDYIYFIDYQTRTFICNKDDGIISDTYVCPPDFPYKYGNSCIRNCSDTNQINEKTTYSLINNEAATSQKKFCVENCETENFYLDPTTLSCYKNCKETSNKFYEDHSCYKNCSSVGSTYEYYNDDTFECVEECTNSRYKSIPDKTCYRNLVDCYKNSDQSLIYINPEQKICNLTCNDYILKTVKDEKNIYYCLSSCTTKYKLDGTTNSVDVNYYRKNDDKMCIESCENDIYYKYKPYSGYNEYSYICYKSCKDISSAYKFEYNYICYKNAEHITETKQYFYEKDG